jgi:hypothetical protein
MQKFELIRETFAKKEREMGISATMFGKLKISAKIEN